MTPQELVREVGVTSAEIGAELLKFWQLPEELYEPILHQHQPERSQAYNKSTFGLSLALEATNLFEPEVKGSRDLVPESEWVPVNDKTQEVLGISEARFNILVFEADMECFDVFTVLSSRTP